MTSKALYEAPEGEEAVACKIMNKRTNHNSKYFDVIANGYSFSIKISDENYQNMKVGETKGFYVDKTDVHPLYSGDKIGWMRVYTFGYGLILIIVALYHLFSWLEDQ